MFKLTTDDINGQTLDITDSLDELARQGARRMIATALEMEVEQYVQALRHLRDDQGRELVDKTEKVVPGENWQVYYALFARAGFTDAAHEEAEIVGAQLVDLTRLDADLREALEKC